MREEETYPVRKRLKQGVCVARTMHWDAPAVEVWKAPGMAYKGLSLPVGTSGRVLAKGLFCGGLAELGDGVMCWNIKSDLFGYPFSRPETGYSLQLVPITMIGQRVVKCGACGRSRIKWTRNM